MKVGVVGGGQLGRMLGLAGIPLGMHLRFLEPSPACPAAACGEVVPTSYDDEEGLARFIDGLAVSTYEFENVPADTAQWIAGRVPLSPGVRALVTAQDRITEKSLFRSLGIPVQPFAAVGTRREAEAAATAIGAPCVLKTRRMGYDGKGQCVITEPTEGSVEGRVVEAWETLSRVPCILESFVEHTAEVSMIAVRSKPPSGQPMTIFYPLTENVHREGILWRSIAPAPCDPMGDLDRQARAFVQRLVDSLDYVGTVAVEFFVTSGTLVANEMAPRVHNSGHWTIDGATTSQFENHLRAIAAWPLGSAAMCTGVSAMVNLVGCVPSTAELLAIPGARVHLYGKGARPGRKVGHVTLCADTPARLEAPLRDLESRVVWA